MRMFLLSSDEDTITGLRLAGVEGRLVLNEEEFQQGLSYAFCDENIGILLISKELSALYPEAVLEAKKSGHPLVTEIPDMKNPTSAVDSITGYVRDAIGLSF